MKPEQEQRIVEEHLRKNGFRWTNQRALIVRSALATHEHFTADELLDRCRQLDARVSRATVYRTLAVLEEAGFVEGLDTGDGGRKFEHVLGHEHHDHMVCTACGTIFEFHDVELERRQELAARRLGFRIERHSLRIYGRCQSCRSARKNGGSRGAAK
ncbi:MAG: transcriptional repressor [Planctomycetes bacterium]|nr:transcriptional repressor [Planctomycetota bacterium]